MTRFGLAVAAIAALVAIPATASANHGTTCAYTSTQSTAVPVPGTGIVVYEGHGTSGDPTTTAVGVCDYSPTTVGPISFAGETVEAGAGTPTGGPGVYAIADGDNANTDPTAFSDGYIGVSNFETGTKDTSCDGTRTGSGTNSGGCLGHSSLVFLPVPLIACGNTSGPTWDNNSSDGCDLRDIWND